MCNVCAPSVTVRNLNLNYLFNACIALTRGLPHSFAQNEVALYLTLEMESPYLDHEHDEFLLSRYLWQLLIPLQCTLIYSFPRLETHGADLNNFHIYACF